LTSDSQDQTDIENPIVTDIGQATSHEEVIKLIKSNFIRIDVQSCIRLARMLLDNQTKIEIRDFKKTYTSFIRKNLSKFEEVEKNKKTLYYLKQEIISEITVQLYCTIEKIGSALRDIDEDDKKWERSNIDGVEAFEVTNPTTFQNIREKADKEGKHVSFRYDFSQVCEISDSYENKLTTQIIDVHINGSGEIFDYPLQFCYRCPICHKLSKRYEFEVASVSNKHKCTTLIPAEPKSKKCNTLLSPDTSQTETKTCFVYNISFKDKHNSDCKAEAISFISLPRGYLQVAIQKIPNSFGQMFLHIVDYRPIKKESMQLPEKKKNEHYLFSMINTIDKYIIEKTQYEHFGFLPMKMAILLQMAARYNVGFLNNFSIGMTGAKSSGKSQFAKYWGIALYAEHSLVTTSTSISIAKLRGTMETFTLFGKEHRFQYRGLFGEKDLIVVDELKENLDVKNNLKQYLLEVNYDYSKAGGSSQTYKRNAHFVATQNVDTKHLDKYTKEVKALYQSENLKLVNEDKEPKVSWDQNEDLTLPLNSYRNPYLRYSVKKIRAEYERNEVNWIDGSELALKQRFFFYFFLGSDKSSDELTQVIRGNAMRDVIADNIALTKLMEPSVFRKYFESLSKYNKGTNDGEYFDKVDDMLNKYSKRQDARTKGMMYSLLKLIRIIDGRNYCTKEDLKIFQFILESLDNKVEVIDTNNFKINGPYIDDSESLIKETSDEDEYGYSHDSLEDF